MTRCLKKLISKSVFSLKSINNNGNQSSWFIWKNCSFPCNLKHMSSIAISENPDRLLRPKATLMEIISFILTVSALFFFFKMNWTLRCSQKPESDPIRANSGLFLQHWPYTWNKKQRQKWPCPRNCHALGYIQTKLFGKPRQCINRTHKRCFAS